ncbi:MAG: thiamine phosphate synthase [Acetobacteraceae bacterium]|nr:thiamine phosphate synthase [Acetobacteraceae bacterium]
MKLPEPPLLVITDRHQARLPLEEIAEAVFAAGCRWLSLREKDLLPVERLVLLERLRVLAEPWGATVGVHGDLQAARAVPEVALHLSAGEVAGAARAALGPERLIGRSAHVGDPLARPDVAELDYVTLSPVFASASKPGYGPALGLAGLAAAVRGAVVPVIALGGVGVGNLRACLEAGPAGVAVMGEVMRAADPGGVVAAMVAVWEEVEVRSVSHREPPRTHGDPQRF